MKELKFRARIPERNATIYFDLTDLVHPSRKNLFSQELLVPWLLAGNLPDLYSEMKDKNDKEIYASDKIKIARWRFEVSYSDSMWYLEPIDGTDSDFLTNYKSEEIEVIE
jgi:hypothetical protein